MCMDAGACACVLLLSLLSLFGGARCTLLLVALCVATRILVALTGGSLWALSLMVLCQAVIKPAALSFVEAAALPLASLTAYQCFTQHVKTPVGPGSKVLILGGTGGVGCMAIQIAKALGAETVAATGSNTALIKELGADVAINYREADWGEVLSGQNYDVIFATVNDDKPSPAAERALKVGAVSLLASVFGGGVRLRLRVGMYGRCGCSMLSFCARSGTE